MGGTTLVCGSDLSCGFVHEISVPSTKKNNTFLIVLLHCTNYFALHLNA